MTTICSLRSSSACERGCEVAVAEAVELRAQTEHPANGPAPTRARSTPAGYPPHHPRVPSRRPSTRMGLCRPTPGAPPRRSQQKAPSAGAPGVGPLRSCGSMDAGMALPPILMVRSAPVGEKGLTPTPADPPARGSKRPATDTNAGKMCPEERPTTGHGGNKRSRTSLRSPPHGHPTPGCGCGRVSVGERVLVWPDRGRPPRCGRRPVPPSPGRRPPGRRRGRRRTRVGPSPARRPGRRA